MAERSKLPGNTVYQIGISGHGDVIEHNHIRSTFLLGKCRDVALIVTVVHHIDVLIVIDQEGNKGVAEGFLDDQTRGAVIEVVIHYVGIGVVPADEGIVF